MRLVTARVAAHGQVFPSGLHRLRDGLGIEGAQRVHEHITRTKDSTRQAARSHHVPDKEAPMPESEDKLEAAVDAVIEECEGNLRAALRVLIVANSYLEAEVERLAEAVSHGYARGDIRRPARSRD
jgi:hypothetical protein